jgi:uroporphyrinogen-III synthase
LNWPGDTEVEMAFLPFIRLEGIPSKDFRRRRVEIGMYSAVIFTSRHAIDHFFRTAEEMKSVFHRMPSISV